MIDFFLGVIASLAATGLWQVASSLIVYRRLSKICGFWLQEIPAYAERQYSIGQFAVNPYTGRFSWRGTNFTNDGSIATEWESTSIYLDKANHRILFTFQGSTTDKPFNVFHGFGVINMKESHAGVLEPVGGYFQDVATLTPQSFTLTRLERIATQLNMPRNSLSTHEYHRALVHEHQKEKVAIPQLGQAQP